jgi:hypothetical protein
MAIATFLDSLVTTPNSHLFLSVYSASRQLLLLSETLRVACFPAGVQVGEPQGRTGFSVVKKNYFSTAEAQRTQSKELANEEVV